MPANWQREKAKTRQPYLAQLVVTPGTPCHFCSHPRSSHSMLVLQHSCKAGGCGCPQFEPICGCGHVLSEHQWGIAPQPWGCAFCQCAKFGANQDGIVDHKPPRTVYAPPSVTEAKRKEAELEKHVKHTPAGKVAWGRRPLDLFDCGSKGCPELATYWTSRTRLMADGRTTQVKAAYCGPHFRRWANTYIPDKQMSLF
jgi:hypothetical protein